jgi:hypothetical protein
VRFETPAALWGLGSLVLLILFSLWRQASIKVVVPSLLLWKRIPERNPPVRALRRPRWRLELLLQALAISAGVGALAGPYRETSEPKPRRIALAFDTSARMRAGDRLARMQDVAKQKIQDLLLQDLVTIYDAAPSPRRIASPAEARYVDTHVDRSILLQSARAEADRVILLTDRETDGADAILFGAPADNAGIVEFSMSDDEAFVRLVNHGPERPLAIELRAADLTVRETVPAGQRTWSHKADYSKAPSVRIALETKDSFPLDDAVEATRLVTGGSLVTLTGRHHDALVKVLNLIPGVTVQRGGGAALVAVGYDEAPGPGDLRVFIHSPSGVLPPGEAVIATHPLMHDLERRGPEFLSSGLGELAPADRAGTPLITVGGKVAAAVRGKEVHLCIDLNRWQAGPVSFPIFWVNVVDVARKSASGWTVLRTGRPVLLFPNSTVESGPAGAIPPVLTPEGTFTAFTVGDYRLKTSDGDRTLHINLLDERESDTAGTTRDLAWNPGDLAGRALQRKDLSGLGAGCALVFLVLAWLLQLRPE